MPRELNLIAAFSCLLISGTVLILSGGLSELAEWRFSDWRAPFEPRTLWLGLSSFVGWISTLIVLYRTGGLKRSLGAFQPVSLMMALSGMGVPLLALTVLNGVLFHACRSRGASLIPVLALALAFAAITVPRFEIIFLALASPLFVCAPAGMRQGHIAAFYGLVLSPALLLLLIRTGLAPVAAWVEPSRSLTDWLALAPLLILTGALFLTSRGDTRRGLLITSLVGLSAFFSNAAPTSWPIILLGLGLAYAVHDTRNCVWQIATASAFGLALALDASQLLAL